MEKDWSARFKFSERKPAARDPLWWLELMPPCVAMVILAVVVAIDYFDQGR